MKKTSIVLLSVLVVLLSSCGTKEITDPHEGYKVIEQVTFNLVKLSSLTFKSVSHSSNHIDYEYITETNTKVEFYSNNALYRVSKIIGLYDDQRGRGIKEYNNEAYAKLENGYITVYSVNDGVSSKYVGEYKGTIDELYLSYFPEHILIGEADTIYETWDGYLFNSKEEEHKEFTFPNMNVEETLIQDIKSEYNLNVNKGYQAISASYDRKQKQNFYTEETDYIILDELKVESNYNYTMNIEYKERTEDHEIIKRFEG